MVDDMRDDLKFMSVTYPNTLGKVYTVNKALVLSLRALRLLHNAATQYLFLQNIKNWILLNFGVFLAC